MAVFAYIFVIFAFLLGVVKFFCTPTKQTEVQPNDDHHAPESVYLPVWAVSAVKTNDTCHHSSFSVLSIEQAFDPDQAVIWETQDPALQLIASAGSEGLLVERLRPFYIRSAHRYPELYDGATFVSWLAFLQHVDIITMKLGMASLTTSGQQFLKYRVTTGDPITSRL